MISQRLDLQPIVKYSALAFFADRFLPALPRCPIILESFVVWRTIVLISRPGCVRKMGFCGARSGRVVRSWLLEPLRDSNLELFALVAVWIASKVRHCEPFLDRTLCACLPGAAV